MDLPPTKRDRWASSSEDEEPKVTKRHDDKEKKKRRKNDRKQSHRSSALSDRVSSASHVPLHNPLLQGCRSVYETYERLERVSEGTYGVVWKARDLATTDIVALKQIKFHAATDNYSSATTLTSSIWKEGFPVTALREINVLLALSHENIVSVKEMVVGDGLDKVFMVMEFFECDLKTALCQASTGGPLAQSELKGILQQILSGIAHMHSHWYMHRDLKPSNILVKMSSSAGGHNDGGRIALADFGLARRFHDPAIAMTLPVVTLWYRAPELLFGETKYGPSIDMWSVGCIMGELIESGGNFQNSDDDDESNAILKGQGELDQINRIFSLLGVPDPVVWPDFALLPNAGLLRWKPVPESNIGFPKKFQVASTTSSTQTFLDGNGYNLLRRLLTLDPSQRITATDALEHAYFIEGVAPQIPRFFASSNDAMPRS